MKCTIPEISWHNRDPVLSVDVQPVFNGDFYRLASGGTDSHVLIWHLRILYSGAISVEPVADLTRHQRAVNVVRWSPTGQYLASGDDDTNIIIWQQKADELAEMLDGESADKEKWTIFKVLRGHKEDVYDISWSPNSLKLLSGSVDNTAIIWDLSKGSNENILKDHKGFVQGVSWDPEGQYLATLSSDRTCRIFNETGKQVKFRISKGTLDVPEGHPLHGQIVRYYHDDTLKSFYRRLSFSPDGNLLVTPAGCLDIGESNKPLYTTYIYAANNFQTPAVILPSPGQYTTAVKFCPIFFELRSDGPDPVISLPYRMVFAVATKSSVVLYDTQQVSPFAVISNIHYTRLTDLTWSQDGRILAVSSTDGFCSLVTFDIKELGTEYVKEESDEENMDQSVCEDMNESVTEDKIDEKKDEKKRPSFLKQWASKKVEKTDKIDESNKDTDVILITDTTPKRSENNAPPNLIEVRRKPLENIDLDNTSTSKKSNNNPAKLIAVRRKPKDETQSPSSNNVSAKPIAVRRKPKNEEIDSLSSKEIPDKLITIQKTSKEEPSSSNTAKTNVEKLPNEESKNSPSKTTPAKPITVRKKPRDQMDITKFLKSPKELTKQRTEEKHPEKEKCQSKITLFNESKEPPLKKNATEKIVQTKEKCITSLKNEQKMISEDSVANDAWPSSEKMEITSETPHKYIETIVIEDSNDTQNMRLIIEDTEDIKSESTNESHKIEVCDKSENNSNTSKTSSESNLDTEKQKDENITKSDTNNLGEKTELNDIKNKINDLQLQSPLRKKKVPFITLSSPKRKKDNS